MIAQKTMATSRGTVRRRAGRARIWFLAPLIPGEAALVSLVVIGIIVGFGWLAGRQMVPVLGISVLVGSAIRAVGFCCASA